MALLPLRASAEQAFRDFDVSVAFSTRDDALAALLRELRSARRSIDAALFYLSHAELVDALCNASRDRGVHVRVLTDVESARPSERHILGRLAQHGVQVYVLPVPNGKMHLKAAVVDGQAVLTGAANWTPQAFQRNVEDTVIVRSTGLAEIYTRQFNALIARSEPFGSAGSGSVLSTTATSTLASRPAAVTHQMEAFFSPGREGPRRLSEQIAGATSRVEVAMYLLNDPAMIRVLADKARSGTAKVSVLVDSGMLTSSLRPILQELSQSGAEIAWWNRERSSMHLKVTVIDGHYVWTGSANWTPSAFDRNIEDMLLLDDPELANAYLEFLGVLRRDALAFQPMGQLPQETGIIARTTRDGYVVGLPPTGPRTNWSVALSTKAFPSFDVTASVQYLPDDDYFPVLLQLIRTARQSVLVTMYVFPEPKANEPLKEQLINTLVAAVQRGVYVYLVLHMPSGEGDPLAKAHEYWAENLRAKGVDVRLHVPTVPLHDKMVVVDLAKILIGSHNWTEGALSGERVHEAAALLVLPQQDIRWADYVFGLAPVSDMRSRDHWQEELRKLRHLAGLSGSAQQAFIRELEATP